MTRPPCSTGACDWQPYADRPDLEHCATAGCGVGALCGQTSIAAAGWVCERPAGHPLWHACGDGNLIREWSA